MIATCERFEARLGDHLEGDLRGRDRLAFAVHWLACRACRLSLASYRQVVRLVREALRDDDPKPRGPGAIPSRGSGSWRRPSPARRFGARPSARR